MHEKRRYGELVLHRVTEAMSNAQAKERAADIRAGGYRARLDTWQGQFAVWSDKGLTDPTMPPRARRSGGGGRRVSRRRTVQAEYDKLVSTNKSLYPLQKFRFQDRWWGWHGAAYSESERKKKTTAWTKQGYDVEWLSFKGSGIPLCYVSKWKDGKALKATPEQAARAVGVTDTRVAGVITLKRKGKIVTHRGKKWERYSCHLSVVQAREEAKVLVEEFHVKLFTFKNSSLICIYTRSKRLKKMDKTAVVAEVFVYLDKLHKAGVSPQRYKSILEEVYGMNPQTAQRLVSRWSTDRKIGEKPPTHPGRRGISKGVYSTKSEHKAEPRTKDEVPKGRPEKTTRKRIKLLDSGYKNAAQMSNTLGMSVSKVVYAREFGKRHLLTLVRRRKQYRIYEVRRNTRGPNKGKLGERKLVDKFSVRTSKDGIERAFRRALSKRGVQ